jgi:S-adenosylmethionine decarboxylase
LIRTQGTHILLELWQVPELSLSDFAFVKNTLIQATTASCTSYEGFKFSKCKPTGISGVLLLKEGHLSVRTWPERGYASFDIYTCGGEVSARKAMKYLVETLKPGKHNAITIERGFETNEAMQIKINEVV